MSASLEHSGRGRSRAICRRVVARAGHGAATVLRFPAFLMGKNTGLQASVPVLILPQVSQAGCPWGVFTARLLSRAVGNARLFGNLLKPSRVELRQQPFRVVNVLLSKSPFVFAAVVHGSNHRNERHPKSWEFHPRTRTGIGTCIS